MTSEVARLLDAMVRADTALYDKILETPGFAYYFNELVKLADSKAGGP